MSDTEKSFLEDIEGLEPLEPATIEKFRRDMTENVVPRIIDAVEERRLAAAKSRGKPLKY